MNDCYQKTCHLEMKGDACEKTIVLVEGTSDKEILEFSLRHIYQHLYNLFYFMDFQFASNKQRQGGVDSILNNIKTFIASRLKARFIANFDNDTVGVNAKNKLEQDIKKMPSNFRLLNYLDLNFAKKYPTLTPNGKILLDNINKRACSIEQYLPLNLISNNCIPNHIEWNSLVSCKLGEKTISNYQGVISQKEKIKEKFFNLKKNIENMKEDFVLAD